jgi:hypothetical protein
MNHLSHFNNRHWSYSIHLSDLFLDFLFFLHEENEGFHTVGLLHVVLVSLMPSLCYFEFYLIKFLSYFCGSIVAMLFDRKVVVLGGNI